MSVTSLQAENVSLRITVEDQGAEIERLRDQLGQAQARIETDGRELERLRTALERGTYYINRLEAAQRGHVVRDLDEASNAWESDQARCSLEQGATPKPRIILLHVTGCKALVTNNDSDCDLCGRIALEQGDDSNK